MLRSAAKSGGPAAQIQGLKNWADSLAAILPLPLRPKRPEFPRKPAKALLTASIYLRRKKQRNSRR